MVSDVHTFLYASLFRRISSVAVIGVCILCSFPHSALCLAIDESSSKEFVGGIINNISDGDSNRLIERFDELEGAIHSSENPLQESRKFLQSFIEEINKRYGLNLTIQEACALVRENLHALQLPPETQHLLLETIVLLEADFSPTAEQTQHFEKAANSPVVSLNIRPWEWSWFGLNEKSYKDSKQRSATSKDCKQSPATSFASPPLLQISGTDKELPSTIYVGGVEAFAGVLVCALGLVFPPAYGVGTALIIDGTIRVFNGLEEMDKQGLTGSNQGPFDMNF